MDGVKAQFPLFQHHPELVYLDNAATTQKPQAVIDGISTFYEKSNANIHRGIYRLAAEADQQYEAVRQKVASFLHAPDAQHIIFTSGTTASINLVAQSFLANRLQPGDEVLISAMEHHANLIPWQQLCRLKNARLRIIPLTKDFQLDMKAFREMLHPRVKLLAVTHISNVLGTHNPVQEMISMAHKQEIPVLLDAAQSAVYGELDMQQLEVDFCAFSAHKMLGPTGVGVLYAREKWLAEMQPVVFGGDMIKAVSFEESTFAEAPRRLEAGTANIAGVIGLGHAIDFLNQFEKGKIRRHAEALGQIAQEKLLTINGLQIMGPQEQAKAVISFCMKSIHPHDIATFLDDAGIAIRAGHHCAQPLMAWLGVAATSRISFSLYNEASDIDRLIAALKEIHRFFA